MTTLASKIRDEIETSGAISFARFMDLSLYSPGLGYYEREREIGRRGDFYTSVSVGGLFGELLAFQFLEWFEQTEVPTQKRKLQLVESGAHDGRLALDILNWFQQHCPNRFDQLDYVILEPSPQRRDWQRKTLGKFSGKISWFDNWQTFPRSEFSVPRFTICFSNELFDAFPVHRLAWNSEERRWFELGVAWDGKSFIWTKLNEPVSGPELDGELLKVLPNGFIHEVCPAAVDWWKEAALQLQCGKLVAIDYGFLQEEFFVPQRSNGTLRAYFQHRANTDLLANPGEQDLTAHVNFSGLKQTGESAGLRTELLKSQAGFLTEIAGKTMVRPQFFGEWNPKRAKQFQTLTHPEHLGRSFRVLVQSR